jgi:hypothetical protein
MKRFFGFFCKECLCVFESLGDGTGSGDSSLFSLCKELLTLCNSSEHGGSPSKRFGLGFREVFLGHGMNILIKILERLDL